MNQPTRLPLHPIIRLLLPALVLLATTLAVNAQEEPPTGQVEGRVVNLTADGSTPAGIPIHLFILDNFEPVETFTGTLTADGSFLFDDIPLLEGQLYIATLEYQEVAYGSPFVEYDGLEDSIQLEIETYEPTMDAQTIEIARLHVIVDFVDEVMQISELYIFNNNSDRVYVGPFGMPDRGTLEIPVPAGIDFPQVSRARGDSMIPANNIVEVAGGFLDTLPVRPGEGTEQLMLTYEYVYAGELYIEHQLPYPASSVSLIMPDAGLEVESELLTSAGQQTAMGANFLEWSAADLPAGETLAFRITGEADMSASSMAGSELPANHPDISGMAVSSREVSPLSVEAGDNSTTWTISIAGLIISALVVAFFWMRRPATAAFRSRESLLEAIAALDDAHQAGELASGRYQLEREQLKSELRQWYEN